MKAQLTNKLFDKYPKLFIDKPSIGCGDGWYWLIDNLCENIEFAKNFKIDIYDVKITYIKEKFGVLDVFYEGHNQTILNYSSFATHLSTKICEECGSTKYMGKTSVWIRHLCKDCGEKNKNPWTPNDDVMKEIRKDKIENLNKLNEKEKNNN